MAVSVCPVPHVAKTVPPDWTHPGCEFHEGTFELVPVDDAAAEVLKGSALEKAFQAGPTAGAAIGNDFDAPKEFKKCACNWPCVLPAGPRLATSLGCWSIV